MRTAGVAPAIALFIVLAAAGTPARSASSIEDTKIAALFLRMDSHATAAVGSVSS